MVKPDISCFENSVDPAQIGIVTSFHCACNTCITGLTLKFKHNVLGAQKNSLKCFFLSRHNICFC